ncbi:preprotein translocase subunit Tim44 [Defluviimonas sp. 20V17]|uniref:Predicted lipid-binding transport protein, Tim44 family n=1 Tax=Allgaiera indica TaxID=765699 RepID=A0AAN4UNE8_9RHOB|nr:Tim44/TimA family putative adaptor protein [Allgaiera indica]KDB03621.1 preprotein translocase subunit Tim44 [Defluviimonas sp. 20V17]GHD98268.1 preprotein translocase subunit Tim44 [Allgaiera indica]SDW50427.1 Predicted lipid-binding transport protein, Tim44 family [Allgaiera indica]
MSGNVIQLIVLGAVALFLIFKLKSTLGTREGFEKPAVPKTPDEPNPVQRRAFDVIEGGPDADITDHVPDGSAAAEALTAMKRAEPSFSVGEFMRGARGAYEMILGAFYKGDLDSVAPFIAPEVLESFREVVRQREAQGLTLEANIIGIREVVLASAEFHRDTQEGEVTVRFVSEQTSAVKNAQDEIVEGDPKAVRRQRDVWTFGRKMGVNDPNWQLVATGE